MNGARNRTGTMGGFIRRMEAECLHRRVKLGQMVNLAEEGAAGALLFFPAMIILLPLSIIPGLSTACAVLLLFVSAQHSLGKDTLWLPEKLRNLSMKGVKLFHVLRKLEKPAQKIDRISKPRIGFLTRGLPAKFAAMISCILSLITIFVGFLPLIDVLLMLPVVLFSLGMCTGDGLAAALGWVVIVFYAFFSFLL